MIHFNCTTAEGNTMSNRDDYWITEFVISMCCVRRFLNQYCADGSIEAVILKGQISGIVYSL